VRAVNRGRWVISLIACLGAVGLWGVSVASAHPSSSVTREYRVEYGGAGKLSSRIISLQNCGQVTRVEDTGFTWHTSWDITLKFTRSGENGAKDSKQPERISQDDNESKVNFGGCDGGTAECHGSSEPRPNDPSTAQFSAASSGHRVPLFTDALGDNGYYTGADFSGAWNMPYSGSCDLFNYDNGFGILLLPESSQIAPELEAKVSVPYASLKNLKGDNFLDYKVSPGHMAPAHRDDCFKDDGCESETFSWNGEVSIAPA
jgi:hypothetical protein